MTDEDWQRFETLFQEIIDAQENKVMKAAQRIVPHVTKDDIMQPNDFPDLENNPFFRYEEGVLEGVRTCAMAFAALWREREGAHDGS